MRQMYDKARRIVSCSSYLIGSKKSKLYQHLMHTFLWSYMHIVFSMSIILSLIDLPSYFKLQNTNSLKKKDLQSFCFFKNRISSLLWPILLETLQTQLSNSVLPHSGVQSQRMCTQEQVLLKAEKLCTVPKNTENIVDHNSKS